LQKALVLAEVPTWDLRYQGWQTYGTQKDFRGTHHSLLSQFSFISLPDQRDFCEEYVYTHTHTHISDCIHTQCELLLLPNKTAVKHFDTNREECKVLTGYLSLGRWTGGVRVNTRHWKKKVLQSSFQTGSSSSPSYFQIFFLIAFLEEAFIRNIKIIL
jgi:hypothetical protein